MSIAGVVLILLTPATPTPLGSPVPAFTNADLDRLAPRRGEGGIFETSTPVPPAASAASSPASKARGEEYWRREAERTRDRLRPLEERAETLRTKIAERQRVPGVRPYSDPGVRALQRDLGRVEEHMRDLQSRLEDRARREGALPGWLR
jgi:hypothetical protein